MDPPSLTRQDSTFAALERQPSLPDLPNEDQSGGIKLSFLDRSLSHVDALNQQPAVAAFNSSDIPVPTLHRTDTGTIHMLNPNLPDVAVEKKGSSDLLIDTGHVERAGQKKRKLAAEATGADRGAVHSRTSTTSNKKQKKAAAVVGTAVAHDIVIAKPIKSAFELESEAMLQRALENKKEKKAGGNSTPLERSNTTVLPCCISSTRGHGDHNTNTSTGDSNESDRVSLTTTMSAVPFTHAPTSITSVTNNVNNYSSCNSSNSGNSSNDSSNNNGGWGAVPGSKDSSASNTNSNGGWGVVPGSNR